VTQLKRLLNDCFIIDDYRLWSIIPGASTARFGTLTFRCDEAVTGVAPVIKRIRSEGGITEYSAASQKITMPLPRAWDRDQEDWLIEKIWGPGNNRRSIKS
jgi:hypothetical protein